MKARSLMSTAALIAALIGSWLLSGGVAAAGTATSTVPPDCQAITAAQNKVDALQKKYNHSKLVVAQDTTALAEAEAATPPVPAKIDAARAALRQANTDSYNLYGALSAAQTELTTAVETAKKDGVKCPPDGAPKTTTPSSPPPSDPTGPTNGSGGTSTSSDSSATSSGGSAVAAGGSGTGGSAQNTTVVDPNVVLDPTAGDGSQANTSGSEISDVPTGSASTGAA